MSAPGRPQKPAAPAMDPKARPRISAEDQKELDLLEQVIDKRIKRNVPPTPYILSTPSMKPYHHYSKQEARAWMLKSGRLFSAEEEHLQYRTFLYREQDGQDIFVLQAGEEYDTEVERPKSQASNTPHAGPKKKISFSAYKSKQANGVVHADAPKVSSAASATKPTPTQTNGVNEAKEPPNAALTQEGTMQQKRAATETLDPEKPAKIPRQEHTVQPLPKIDEPIPLNMDASNGTPHGLPPLLSPVHEHINNPWGLPAILSPTLPSNIQAELDKPRAKDTDTQSEQGKSSTPKSTPDKKTQLASKPATPATNLQRGRGDSSASTSSAEKKSQVSAKLEPRISQRERAESSVSTSSAGKTDRLPPKPESQISQRERAESGASTSSTAKKDQLSPKPESRSQKSELKPSNESPVRSAPINGKSPNVAPTSSESSQGSHLIVKLKYGKRNVSPVRRILKLSPSRKAQSAGEKKEAQVHNENGDRSVKAEAKAVEEVVQKNKTGSKTVPRSTETAAVPGLPNGIARKVITKRPRAGGDSPTANPPKRAKQSQDGLNTPSQPISSSPATSSKSSTQKSQTLHVTPVKDHKAVTMLRTTSSESYGSTPGKSGATPASIKATPTSVASSSKKQADLQSLSETSKKLNQIGRSLKHQVQKILTEKGKRLTEEDHKREVVTSLECILSYMAAFGIQDQSDSLRSRSSNVEGTWKTLLPLCRSYAPRSKDIPHLEGLRLYLSVVICATICTLVAPRGLKGTAKAHDSPQTPDAMKEDLAKQLAQANEHFALLAGNYQQLFLAAQDARSVLPIEDIQKHYPKTWGGRETNARLAKQPEKFGAGNLSGPYFLPIGDDTTPLQAVRFGIRFLEEYVEMEKLEYTFRVDLARNLEKSE